MRIIGIAGGSGSGKSSVSYALVDDNPKLFEVLNFDDYHKLCSEAGLPMIDDMINWDHPDVIDWQTLISDISTLKNGHEITIQTWAHRSNTTYTQTHQRIFRLIRPKPTLIVEGNLILHNPDVIKLFDSTFYLDVNDETRNVRRDKNEIIGHDDYVQKVLEPMHKKYVEPSKKDADTIIDSSGKSIDEIKQKILEELN